MSTETVCNLCGLDALSVSKHHLVPKAKRGKDTVVVCNECHKQIHSLFTNKELANQYNTIELLKIHPAIKAWIGWRCKHPNVVVSHAMSKKRKQKGKYS